MHDQAIEVMRIQHKIGEHAERDFTIRQQAIANLGATDVNDYQASPDNSIELDVTMILDASTGMPVCGYGIKGSK